MAHKFGDMKTVKEIQRRLDQVEKTIYDQQGRHGMDLEVEAEVLRWVLVSTGDCPDCAGDFEIIGRQEIDVRHGYPPETVSLIVEIFRCKQCKRYHLV